MHKKFFLATVVFITILSFGEKADAVEREDKNVIFIDNGIISNYQTQSETVKEFLHENKINLGEEDYINKKMDAEIFDGINIEIGHPFKLKILVDDQERYFFVGFNDEVVDLIRILKNEYKKDFICDKNSSCKLRNCTDLKFYSREIKLIDTKQDILFKTEFIDSHDINNREDQIIQEGINGEKIITEEIVIINGTEKSREIKAERLIKEPVNKIIKRGTSRCKKVLNMTATAYTAGFESTGKRPGDRGYGITATGTKARHGTVAVDPRVIPLGTKLYVDGYGYATALDTGGAIKNNKIDLFYDKLSDAKKFGRRNITVYVLD